MLATEGGVRFRSLDADLVFHSEHGLETSSFYALAMSDYGVFAVSEYGIVAQFEQEKLSWHVQNRSYLNNNVRVIPGNAKISRNILVIAFEDRLAFYDVAQSRSILTIDRLGSYELKANPIRQILIRDDSLYVKTDRAVFARQMSWESLSSDRRLSDPGSWVTLPKAQLVEGLEPRDKSTVKVHGKELKNPMLFDADTSVVLWNFEGGPGNFLVGSSLIAYCPKGSTEIVDMTAYAPFTIGSTYEIATLPSGDVVAASSDGMLATGNMSGWNYPIYAFNGFGSYTSVLKMMKTLSVLPNGNVFFHVWGMTYQIYSDAMTRLVYGYTPYDGLCFDNFEENYPVSVGSVPAPDNSGFLVATSSKKGYSIVYFKNDGEVHCASQVGSKSVAGTIYARLDEDGSWLIYVAARDGMDVSDIGDLDVFRFPAPKSNGGELANGKRTTYKIGGPIPVDMAYDSVASRLWMVSISNIFYVDQENDTLISPSSMNGMHTGDYTSLATDVHGNLWVGTSSQGVYRLTSKKGSPDTLSVLHFSERNGLLSNNVRDLAIDPVHGVIWFSHTNGVSYYQRNDLKDARANMTDSAKVVVKAYPVPFRPKLHARFTIEGVTESSVVSIYNRGGALIKSFRNEELLGGKLEWDGRDKSGRWVTPGVFYYVVNDGSRNKKGKFIIVH